MHLQPHVGDGHAARAVTAVEHGGSRAIAEEDAGVAVVPIDDGGKFFRANDKNIFINAAGYEYGIMFFS